MVSSVRVMMLALVTGGTAMAAAGESVLLDFSAQWCGPCRSMEPVVDRLIAAGFSVRKVDIDREPALASRFGVTSIPCFVMISEGRPVDRVVGVASYERLVRMFGRTSAAATQPATSTTPVSAPPQSAPAPPDAAGPLQPPDDTTGAASPAEQLPMAARERAVRATVRVCVDDGSGQSYGTGTVIDARDGEALILTCGHLFREAKQKGQITVDLFEAGAFRKVPGQLVSYDLQRDLGFISIRPGKSVVVARVAPQGHTVAPGDPVFSVGCNHGDDPTVRVSHVTSIDRYQGPPNIEVAEAPVEGRSGGGLFDAHGQVIGVCFAADANDNEGLYAGLVSIHAELDRLGLSGIRADQAPSTMAVAGAPRAVPNQIAPAPSAGRMPTPPPSPAPPNRPQMASLSAASPGRSDPQMGRAMALSPSEQAALAEIARRPEGTEVICIIRPADPDEKSEILVLRNVSIQFVERLSRAERASRKGGPQLTSMKR